MGKAKQRVPAAPVAPRKGVSPRGSHVRKKMNSKPDCLNEQEIPYRLREIMRSRDELKNPKSKKKKKAANKQNHGGDIPVPKFRRRRGETESMYKRRMEEETQQVRFLTENQIQREPEREVQAQEKSQKKKEFQKKKLRKIYKKKVEQKVAMLEKDLLTDSVKFGEVALQPPTLTVKPQVSVMKDKIVLEQQQSSERTIDPLLRCLLRVSYLRDPLLQGGQRQLLLMSLLGSGRTAPTKKSVHPSLARQRIVQEERERVVQAYRNIKKHKQQQLTKSFLAMEKLKKPV